MSTRLAFEKRTEELLLFIIEQLGQVMTRLDSLEKRMDSLEARMDSLEARMDSIEQKLDDNHREYLGTRMVLHNTAKVLAKA